MIKGRFQSLQLRLALRVATLYAIATLIVIGVLMSRAYDAARSLGDRELVLRATALSKSVSLGQDGVPHIDLPTLGEAEIFAIRDTGGRIIAASPPRFGEEVTSWPPAADQPVISKLAAPEAKRTGMRASAGGW